MDCETEEVESTVKMQCRRILLKDGRYMIFYTFDDGSGEEATMQPPPDDKNV